MNGLVESVRAALEGEKVWLVGGALRDRILGRYTDDLDLAVEGDPKRLVRLVAKVVGGSPFALSDRFGSWRVVLEDGGQIDISQLQGGSLAEDLARRDLTVNAMAEPLAGGEIVDLFGGLSDLRKGRLRMVSERSFSDDPLRVLRVPRFAVELGFEVDSRTAEVARQAASGLHNVAGERIFAEFKRILSVDAVIDGLELMERLGATKAVLPELIALRGVEQNIYHHLDVYGHTAAVLEELMALEQSPESSLGDCAENVSTFLYQPLANGLTRWQALRLGALFHDLAKPQTRAVTDDGRVTFFGHDEAGAELSRAVLTRMCTSERLKSYVAGLALHHLRLGFLVKHRPLDRRQVYRYLSQCGPVALDVTVLSVADRLATRGKNSGQAISAHLELARPMLCEALQWERRDATPLIKGDRLAAELGIKPGPQLGRLLKGIEEARFAGEVTTGTGAVEYARKLL